jgi:hypothetical protein
MTYNVLELVCGFLAQLEAFVSFRSNVGKDPAIEWDASSEQ